MKINRLHDWDVSPKEAVQIQRELAAKVIASPINKPVKTIAGADISYDKKSNTLFAAVLIFYYPGMELLEISTAISEADFPYVPGLLSFREIPPLIKCFEKISDPPDVILCDSQGIAHPRRFGLASHLGLVLNTPAIGCAKSRLIGGGDEPGRERGSKTSLTDKGEKIGSILRTKTGIKPLYISTGHLIDLDSAVDMVLSCFGGYRLPEPTRRAHLEVNKLRLSHIGM